MTAEGALRRGVEYLCGAQLPSGEFPVDRYAAADLSGGATPDSSPFATTFAVHALSFVGSPVAQDVIARAVAFLLAERRDPGVWTYWTKQNPMAISPDVDVTSCAAHIVRRFAPEQHRNEIDAIFMANQTVRGRFKTWIRALHDRNDVSPCANANVLMYLGDRPETARAASHLCRLIEQRRHDGSDWYYADPRALFYMVARAYHEGAKSLGPCIGAVQTHLEESPADSPLPAALSLCALENIGAGGSAAADTFERHILASQQPDGGWTAAPFYAGPEPPTPHAYWWGSRALTTALCVEALARRDSGT